MDSVIVPSALPVPDYRSRQLRPVAEQLARAPTPTEQVLQGEVLTRERPSARSTVQPGPEFLNARREDHPGFQRRFDNDNPRRQQAINQYTGIEQTGRGPRSSGLDIIV